MKAEGYYYTQASTPPMIGAGLKECNERLLAIAWYNAICDNETSAPITGDRITSYQVYCCYKQIFSHSAIDSNINKEFNKSS